MYTALREKTTIKNDGLIEIRAPALPPGTQVEVIVIVEPPVEPADSLGWPEGFFATFAGSLSDLSLEN